jgi:hypothetical protein
MASPKQQKEDCYETLVRFIFRLHIVIDDGRATLLKVSVCCRRYSQPVSHFFLRDLPGHPDSADIVLDRFVVHSLGLLVAGQNYRDERRIINKKIRQNASKT